MNADDTFFVFDVIMYTKKYCLNTILYTWKQNKKCMKCHIHGFADMNVFLAIFFNQQFQSQSAILSKIYQFYFDGQCII